MLDRRSIVERTAVCLVYDDGHISTEAFGSPFVLGSAFAPPGGDQVHPPSHGCAVCDFVRHATAVDPLFAGEYARGVAHQGAWLRLRGPGGHRARYRRRRGLRRYR